MSDVTPENDSTTSERSTKAGKNQSARSVTTTSLTLPSGTVVTYREPLGSERRDITEGFDGDMLAKTGQLDSALAFTCLVTKDDRNVTNELWQRKQDLLDYKDAQFYEETFVRAVMLSEEELAEAQKLAKKLDEEGVTSISLPSGRKLSFRAPRNYDRRELLSGPEGSEMIRKQGKLEEALAMVCLLKFGESELTVDLTQFTWNKRFDKMTIKESQFYQAVFMSLYFLNRSDMQQINQQAKKAFGSSIALS